MLWRGTTALGAKRLLPLLIAITACITKVGDFEQDPRGGGINPRRRSMQRDWVACQVCFRRDKPGTESDCGADSFWVVEAWRSAISAEPVATSKMIRAVVA